MLQIVRSYHDRLVFEAAVAGRLRLPMMFLRMCLCLMLVAAGGVVASALSLDAGARLALMIPIGLVTMAMLLHLGHVYAGHRDAAA